MSQTITYTETAANLPLKSTASSSSNDNPVKAILNFFLAPEDGSAPYNYVEQPPEGVLRSNIRVESLEVPIHDIRGQESSFDINKHAFLPIPSSELTRNRKVDFTNEEDVKKNYYAEVEKVLLSNLPGSPNRVFIFDHTIRQQAPGSKREPVLRTHIDQTSQSARERVNFHLPDEAETLLQSRVRLVNVWRPINGPVESSPLAVADSSSVEDSQIVGVQHRYPDRTGETAGVKHGNEKWWYWSGMADEERLLLQCYDSETGTRVPHSAFKLPGEDEEGWKGRPRESIEVRALVFG